MARRLKLTPKQIKSRKVRPTRHPRDELGGKPIVDAAEPFTLSIEKIDLKHARKGDPEHCGAAEALLRVKGVKAARVYRSVVFIEYADRVERYMTPQRLARETVSFDRGAPSAFLEGEYHLNPPPESRRLGSYHKRQKVTGGIDKRSAEHMPVKGARGYAPRYHTVIRGKG